jgi:hypothetical protein
LDKAELYEPEGARCAGEVVDRGAMKKRLSINPWEVLIDSRFEKTYRALAGPRIAFFYL